jgi:hypothetical protein
VLLAFLDESKSAKAYYLTALIVPDTEAIALAQDLDRVVEYAQDTYGGVAARAELHAHPLVDGSGDWKRLKHKVNARIDIYDRAIAAVAARPVEVRIRGVEMAGLKRNYGASADPHGTALTFVLERVQWSAADHDDVALVIADEVRGREAGYRSALRRYQESGTWGWRSTTLDRIVDTLHFAPSSDSRLLQAADLVAYAHLQSLRTHPDARAQAANAELWGKLVRAGRIHEASCWFPQ